MSPNASIVLGSWPGLRWYGGVLTWTQYRTHYTALPRNKKVAASARGYCYLVEIPFHNMPDVVPLLMPIYMHEWYLVALPFHKHADACNAIALVYHIRITGEETPSSHLYRSLHARSQSKGGSTQ